MPDDPQPLHLLDRVGQPVVRAVQIHIVDLLDVAGQDHLRPLADPADDRLDLVRRQVLRLVHDHELVRDAPAADVGQRLEHQPPVGDQLVDALLGRVALGGLPVAAPRAQQVREIVEDRLHPGLEFLVLGPRQVPDVAPHRHDRTRHEQLVVALLLKHLGEARGDRQQCLARSCAAQQRHQLHLVVQQQVQRHRLLHIARQDPAHRLARADHRDHLLRVGQTPAQARVRLVLGVLEDHELVGRQFTLDPLAVVALDRQQVGQPIDRQHPLLVQLVDQRARRLDRHIPRVQALGVDLLVLKVLRRDAQRVRLDPRGKVVGHEDRPIPTLVQLPGDGDDLVVRLLLAQRGRTLDRAHHDADRPRLPVGARAHTHAGTQAQITPSHAPGQVARLAQAIQVADGLAGVAGHLVLALLELVELLDHRERDDDIVLLEHKQGFGVVDKHIRVEHELLDILPVRPRRVVLRLRAPPRHAACGSCARCAHGASPLMHLSPSSPPACVRAGRASAGRRCSTTRRRTGPAGSVRLL